MPSFADQIVVVAHFTATEGKENELLAVLHRLIEPTRKEPGCLRYELNQEMDNPRAFTFAEKFASREAFESAISDIGVFMKRWPQALRSLITGRYSMEKHRDLLLGTAGGIKNVIEINP